MAIERTKGAGWMGEALSAPRVDWWDKMAVGKFGDRGETGGGMLCLGG